ncbi:VOC family protein [Thermodesulfobacteriota bacterium]
MSDKAKPLVDLPKIKHVGFVVKNLAKAIKYYTTLFGWGPFEIRDFELKGYTFRGRISDCKMHVGMAHQGSLMIELIEPVEGETPHSEFLREKGEGINHIGLGNVDDLGLCLTELAKEGIKPVYHVEFDYDGIDIEAVYLNTDEFGGIMIELVQFL